MQILFCNDSYPGRFGRMPDLLAADPANRVMFLSFYPRRTATSSPVIHARLNINRKKDELSPNQDRVLFEWGRMFGQGKQALRTFVHIRESGFQPDLIFSSFLDGAALFTRHAFPKAFIVSCFAGFRSASADSERIRAIMDQQYMLAVQSNLFLVRSQVQKQDFPGILHPLIHTWLPYVDTDFFSPGPRCLSRFFPDCPAQTDLVTVHMKGALSSQKELLQGLAALLLRRPDCCVVLSFASAAVADYWLHASASLPESLQKRFSFVCGLEKTAYRDLLRSSTVHVFPEAVRPPLQEMLETMSCASLVMTPAPAPGDEFLATDNTIAVWPEGKTGRQLAALNQVLDQKQAWDPVRAQARVRVCALCTADRVFGQSLDFVLAEYERARKSGLPFYPQ